MQSYQIKHCENQENGGEDGARLGSVAKVAGATANLTVAAKVATTLANHSVVPLNPSDVFGVGCFCARAIDTIAALREAVLLGRVVVAVRRQDTILVRRVTHGRNDHHLTPVLVNVVVEVASERDGGWDHEQQDCWEDDGHGGGKVQAPECADCHSTTPMNLQ